MSDDRTHDLRDHDGGPGSEGSRDHSEVGRGHDDGGDEYSATALGSQWFERPEPEPEPETATERATLVQRVRPDAEPDRVEGEVLRFGPGVTALARDRVAHNSTAAVWHGGTLAGRPEDGRPPEKPRRGGLRRYTLAGVVLLAVLAFLAWQRFGPGLAVQDVSVRTVTEGPGCDGTADVVGVVDTNGRPGTLTYRWARSDGTTSGLLTEKLTRGQERARLHLLWTFHGSGEYRARAELRIVSPSPRTADVRFAYSCP
ncbi:hypothetical protein [Streptomyces sp. CA-251247]|uniref:hypothetical protein n=1 Tax=Streptomyces sp. CA-251247 TaxID=3240062 RepID=UPI003D93BACF